MADDLLITAIQIAGNITGMAIKYGALLSLPAIASVVAGAPITLFAAGIGAAATIGSALIFMGILHV